MEKIIFSKFSNDRDPKFCIATKIIETPAGRYVRKEACGMSARDHVRSIVLHRELLAEKYKDTCIRFAASELCAEGVRIEWVEGDSYAEYLDGLLKENRQEECLDSMEQYFEQAFDTCVNDPTDTAKTVSGVDVDMLFSNVIYHQGEWIDYDYEWFLDCDVPVKFLIYRCLVYYLTSSDRMSLLEYGVYERFGITEEERAALEGMEARFQEYIEGATVPMWKLYKKIRGTVVDVPPIVERRLKECWAQVYYDSGSGFSEEESRRVLPEEFEKNMFRIRLKCPKGVKVVRFDPAWSYCVLQIGRIEDDSQRALNYKANGNILETGRFVFFHEDPQIWIDAAEDTQWIDLEYHLGIIDLDDSLSQEGLRQQYEDGVRMIGELNGQLEQLRQSEQQKQAELQRTQAELEGKRQELRSMEESVSWKITRPLRAVKQKLRGNVDKEN